MPPAVKFSNPPVVEVACSVLFKTLPSFRAAHVGLFWQGIREAFPRLEEAPPIPPILEGAPNLQPQVQFELAHIPPMRRSWLLNNDGSNLIQIQQDRFIFNWKKVGDADRYPSYSVVIKEFEKHLSEFQTFSSYSGGSWWISLSSI